MASGQLGADLLPWARLTANGRADRAENGRNRNGGQTCMASCTLLIRPVVAGTWQIKYLAIAKAKARNQLENQSAGLLRNSLKVACVRNQFKVN